MLFAECLRPLCTRGNDAQKRCSNPWVRLRDIKLRKHNYTISTKKPLQVHTHTVTLWKCSTAHTFIWFDFKFLCSFVYFFLLIGRLDKKKWHKKRECGKAADVVFVWRRCCFSFSVCVWKWKGPQHVLCAAVPIKYSQNINDGLLSRLSLSNYNFNLLFIILFLYFPCGFSKGIIQSPLFRSDPTCVFTVTDCMRRS